MFDSTVKLFDKYFDRMLVEKPQSFNEELALEVQKRLKQLNYIYNSIENKQLRYIDLQWKIYGDPITFRERASQAGDTLTVNISENLRQEMNELIFEIEMLTECFYYLAGRMRTILRNKSAPLPGLQSFECVKARNVRNKLLEHAEGHDSGIFSQSFGVGGDKGPTLKVERSEGQEGIFLDEGLYVNGSEIKANLENLLNKVLH